MLVQVDHVDCLRAIEAEIRRFEDRPDKRGLAYSILNAIMDLDGKPRSVEAEAGPTWRPGDGAGL